MSGHNKAGKPRSRCGPVILEKPRLVSEMLDFTELSRGGLCVCTCMFQWLRNAH